MPPGDSHFDVVAAAYLTGRLPNPKAAENLLKARENSEVQAERAAATRDFLEKARSGKPLAPIADHIVEGMAKLLEDELDPAKRQQAGERVLSTVSGDRYAVYRAQQEEQSS